MSNLKPHEIIKFELYGINSHYRAMLEGYISEEKARDLAQKHWKNLEGKDVKNYFKHKDYRIDSYNPLDEDPTPAAVYDKLAQECWEALEYFELI